jgi:hypothetical protein
METQNLEFKFNEKSTLTKVIQSKEEIATFCVKHGRRPSVHSKTKKERELAIKLTNYTSPNHLCFDSVFTELMNNFPTTLETKVIQSKEEIATFCVNNGRRPSFHSKIKKERGLAIKLRNYTSPNYPCFDSVFTELMNIFPTTLETKTLNKLDKRIKELEDFVEKHKRKPSKSSSNSKELRLYRSLNLLGNAKWLKKRSKFMTREQKIKIARIRSFPTLKTTYLG